MNKGVPFLDVYEIIGRLVLVCPDRGISLDELSLEEYRKESSVFDEDIYEAIKMETCRLDLFSP